MNTYDIIGYPRLVRLNPNVPWKTRGNGALCLQIGKTQGTDKEKIGVINGLEVFRCPTSFTELSQTEQDHLARIVRETIESQARVDDQNTNPGFVLLSERPSSDFYWKAVTTVVSLDDAVLLLQRHHAVFEGYKNKRGLIGATAAICWEPEDRTYELITYRPQNRWGTQRMVDTFSVQSMDAACPSTFDNYDWENHHNRIVPASPCPILYGIRGDDPRSLVTASSLVKSEPFESWLLFETNQGTDDHVQKKNINQIQPFESVIIQGVVVTYPHTIPGGHVLFTLKDATGTIDCAAYEPTKEFRRIIRGLFSGDLVQVSGGVRQQPRTINLEKIWVKHLVSVMDKIENPVCPQCGKHMKSKGTHQGYTCRKCGTKSSTSKLQRKKRELQPGFYEVPVCARRHLSKPLKRMKMRSQPEVIGTGGTP
jgi:tRNA(Ile2)-agmatinylcytidine synthase